MPFGAGAASELAAFEFGLGTGNDQDVLEERETVLMIRIGAVMRERKKRKERGKGTSKKTQNFTKMRHVHRTTLIHR